ncbi:Cell differentiation protein RCD1 like protein [Tritrichomonas foetus]|uniref:Cell differentiation protein RCD1 like protein n=1 Tax=Tritrichomonas foetus TaxID=1144522 RepID=A0A1J4JVB1_9EUKA|nr:Cell differentiation protein RCD1 like protein [Tritrichomonas foetus]|eukprot:OHT02658.1 Cell differentiation protein RCD1 like protein [Tritrichomonas foetus]
MSDHFKHKQIQKSHRKYTIQKVHETVDFVIKLISTFCFSTMNIRNISMSPGRKQSPVTTQQQQQPVQNNGQLTQEQIVSLIKKINKSEKDRAQAVQVLVANRANIPDLALMLWFSPATTTSLLTDILNFYPQLVSTKTNSPTANAVYNSLILLQIIADHEETRLPFVRANIPIYLIPIIHHTLTNNETEYITGVVISIISSIVKDSEPEIIESLVNADFMSTCIHVISLSRGLIRTAATFILNRILSNDKGKAFAIEKVERIQTIVKVYNHILTELNSEFDPQLSKNVVEGYRRILQDQSATTVAGELISDDLRSKPIQMSCDAQYRDLVGQLRNYASRQPKR